MTALIAGRLRTARHMVGLAWRTDRTVVTVIGVLAVAQAVAIAATGLSQRWVVDAVGEAQGQLTVGLLLAVLIGVAGHVATAAGGRTRDNYQADLTDRVDLRVNQEILTATAGIPTLEHLERPEYLDRLALLRAHTHALAGSCWALTDTVVALVSAGLSLWLLIGVSPVLGVLALLALPPLWAAKRAQSRLADARAATAADHRLDEQLHAMSLAPDSGRELYVSGAGPLLDRAADAARQRVVSTMLRARIGALRWQLVGWLGYVGGYVGALVLTIDLVSRGTASLGDLMLVITLGSRLRSQVRLTVDGFSRVADAGHVTRDYLWLRSYARDRRPTATSPAPAGLDRGIELRDVGFTYPGSTDPVLTGVNLTLRAGSTVALVGINGAGKTTLVKLLTGLYAPTAGTVTVDGTPLRDLRPEAWRSRLTGAFQDFVRFELPVREAVGIGRLEAVDDREAVAAALADAGATDLVARLPDGVDTQLGRVYAGAELSEGQWQRLALARALIRRDPLLMVLDEPTAALDPLAEHELYEVFTRETRRAGGRITLLVSHRFSTVREADHIVVLHEGHVAEQGSHEELMAAQGRYATLYSLQAAAYRPTGPSTQRASEGDTEC